MDEAVVTHYRVMHPDDDQRIAFFLRKTTSEDSRYVAEALNWRGQWLPTDMLARIDHGSEYGLVVQLDAEDAAVWLERLRAHNAALGHKWTASGA